MENQQNLNVNLDDEQIKKKVKVVPIEKNVEYKKIGTDNTDNLNQFEITNDAQFFYQKSINYIPVLFFINKKSGSKEGESILKMRPDAVKINDN